MERQLVIEELGNKVFSVNVSPANKQQYLKSYPQATGCCSKKGEHGEPDSIATVKRKLVCSGCGAEVPTKTPWKVIGSKKDAFLFPAAKLDEIADLQEVGPLKLSFVRENPAGRQDIQDRFDDLFFFSPIAEKEAEYAELFSLLRGRTAVGAGVFGNKERQFFVYAGSDNVIRCRCLTDPTQQYSVDAVSLVEVEPQVVDIEQRILEKKMWNSWDVGSWRSRLIEARDNLIVEYALTGVLPEVVAQVKQAKVDDEVARLKALLGE